MMTLEEIALQLTLKAMDTDVIEKDTYNKELDVRNANNIKAVNKFYNEVLTNLYSEESKPR